MKTPAPLRKTSPLSEDEIAYIKTALRETCPIFRYRTNENIDAVYKHLLANRPDLIEEGRLLFAASQKPTN